MRVLSVQELARKHISTERQDYVDPSASGDGVGWLLGAAYLRCWRSLTSWRLRWLI